MSTVSIDQFVSQLINPMPFSPMVSGAWGVIVTIGDESFAIPMERLDAPKAKAMAREWREGLRRLIDRTIGLGMSPSLTVAEIAQSMLFFTEHKNRSNDPNYICAINFPATSPNGVIIGWVPFYSTTNLAEGHQKIAQFRECLRQQLVPIVGAPQELRFPVGSYVPPQPLEF